MCLKIKKNNQAKIAKKDIVVYKHLVNNNGMLFTPYRRDKIKDFNTVLVTDLCSSESFVSKIKYVEQGFHSFNNLKSAITDANYERSNTIAKCIIPKGSKYYVGTFRDMTSLASNQIIYDKVLSERNIDNVFPEIEITIWDKLLKLFK